MATRSTTIVRGTVRSITEDDENKEWQDDVSPVIVSHKKVSNDDGRNHHETAGSTPAYPGFNIDQDNLDIPTFLRRPRD
jgi:hypothetical protein